MAEITLEAVVENLDTVTDFVTEQLEEMGCAMKVRMQFSIAVDELFANIAHYAYGEETGMATVRVARSDDGRYAMVTFMDQGVPYDPLAKEDPDIALSAEERPIGGLGIYMVKKSMDRVTYRYEDGSNVLTIEKAIAP